MAAASSMSSKAAALSQYPTLLHYCTVLRVPGSSGAGVATTKEAAKAAAAVAAQKVRNGADFFQQEPLYASIKIGFGTATTVNDILSKLDEFIEKKLPDRMREEPSEMVYFPPNAKVNKSGTTKSNEADTNTPVVIPLSAIVSEVPEIARRIALHNAALEKAPDGDVTKVPESLHSQVITPQVPIILVARRRGAAEGDGRNGAADALLDEMEGDNAQVDPYDEADAMVGEMMMQLKDTRSAHAHQYYNNNSITEGGHYKHWTERLRRYPNAALLKELLEKEHECLQRHATLLEGQLGRLVGEEAEVQAQTAEAAKESSKLQRDLCDMAAEAINEAKRQRAAHQRKAQLQQEIEGNGDVERKTSTSAVRPVETVSFTDADTALKSLLEYRDNLSNEVSALRLRREVLPRHTAASHSAAPTSAKYTVAVPPEAYEDGSPRSDTAKTEDVSPLNKVLGPTRSHSEREQYNEKEARLGARVSALAGGAAEERGRTSSTIAPAVRYRMNGPSDVATGEAETSTGTGELDETSWLSTALARQVDRALHASLDPTESTDDKKKPHQQLDPALPQYLLNRDRYTSRSPERSRYAANPQNGTDEYAPKPTVPSFTPPITLASDLTTYLARLEAADAAPRYHYADPNSNTTAAAGGANVSSPNGPNSFMAIHSESALSPNSNAPSSGSVSRRDELRARLAHRRGMAHQQPFYPSPTPQFEEASFTAQYQQPHGAVGAESYAALSL